MSTTGIERRGLMLVLSSPSGAGKTTISRELLRRHSGDLELSISYTTRPPRPGEKDGVDYHFVDREAFEALRAEGGFLEHATVYDEFYGTPRAQVETALADGRDVLFDIDWQGTQQLQEKAGDDLVSVFILPPSIEELERRLRMRAQDDEEIVRKRMAKAVDELTHWDAYTYIILNEDIDTAIGRAESILVAERLRRARQSGLAEFVRSMSRR